MKHRLGIDRVVKKTNLDSFLKAKEGYEFLLRKVLGYKKNEDPSCIWSDHFVDRLKIDEHKDITNHLMKAVFKDITNTFNQQTEITDKKLAVLKNGIYELSEKRKEVIELRYGLGYPEPFTLRELSEIYSCTIENINRIQRLAVADIRRHLAFEESKYLLGLQENNDNHFYILMMKYQDRDILRPDVYPYGIVDIWYKSLNSKPGSEEMIDAIPVTEVGLETVLQNQLLRAHIITIADLKDNDPDELLDNDRITPKYLENIKQHLSGLGLEIGNWTS